MMHAHLGHDEPYELTSGTTGFRRAGSVDGLDLFARVDLSSDPPTGSGAPDEPRGSDSAPVAAVAESDHGVGALDAVGETMAEATPGSGQSAQPSGSEPGGVARRGEWPPVGPDGWPLNDELVDEVVLELRRRLELFEELFEAARPRRPIWDNFLLTIARRHHVDRLRDLRADDLADVLAQTHSLIARVGHVEAAP